MRSSTGEKRGGSKVGSGVGTTVVVVVVETGEEVVVVVVDDVVVVDVRFAVMFAEVVEVVVVVD